MLRSKICLVFLFSIACVSAKRYKTLHDVLNHSEIALNQIQLPSDYNDPKDLVENKRRFEEKIYYINRILKARLPHQYHRDLHFYKVLLNQSTLDRLKKNMNIVLKNKSKHTIANCSVVKNKSMLHKIFKNIKDIQVHKHIDDTSHTKRTVYVFTLYTPRNILCFENVRLKFYNHEGKEENAKFNGEKRKILVQNFCAGRIVPDHVNALNQDEGNHSRLQLLASPLSPADTKNLGRMTYTINGRTYYVATTSSHLTIKPCEHFKVVLDHVNHDRHALITEYYEELPKETPKKTFMILDLLYAFLEILRHVCIILEALGILEYIPFLRTL